MRVHDATTLLREIRDLSMEFELLLGAQLAVNQTDLNAMSHLIESGPLTPTALAHRVGVTTAAMTTSIDRLTSAGHVTRAPNPADRRGILVVPSPASIQRAMASLMPMIMGIDAVTKSFTDEQRELITDYLRQVVDVYRASLPKGTVVPELPLA